MENLKQKIIDFFGDSKTEEELFGGSMGLAKAIAIFAHHGQFRENGEYYVTHPINIATKFFKLMCLNGEEKPLPVDLVASFDLPNKGTFEVCMLHDVIEDTDVTLEDIKELYTESGFIAAFERYLETPLKLLTHNKNEDYDIYINKVLTNKTASFVKMLDMIDNLNVTSLISFNEKEVERCHKYINYIKLINDKYHFLEKLDELKKYAEKY